MKNQTVMASVRRQEMWVTSAHARNADRSAAAAESQNGTYLKNMPRTNGPSFSANRKIGQEKRK